MFKKILTEKKKFKSILTNNKRFFRDENKCVWVRINAHR